MFRIFLVFSFFLQAIGVHAQELTSRSAQRKTGGEYYVGLNLGKRLISVNLISGVSTPGVYHIPINTKLSQLFAYAGGILPSSDLESINIRSVNKKGEYRVSNINFKELIKSEDDIYKVKDNDTIVIARDNSFDKTLRWVSLASIVVSILSAIVVVQRK